ncbi:DUF2125 domain-containing protein [Sagittula sp. NFXS13]|uniref:DUF2125 domain-containing protein n=1 Tax=Sagittula sp. NFXS13 TaxID=2819095 RepID=UPI0032DEC044
MKRYVGLVVAAALLWGGYWAVQAWTLRSSIEDWFEDRRLDGWVAQYDDLSVNGFPSRLDVTISGIDLQDPEHQTGWQAPFLQILGLSYQRDHVILAFADSQQVLLPDGPVMVTSDGLRASLVKTDDIIERLNIEAEVLNINGPAAEAALAGVLFNFHHVEGTDYRLALSAQGVATPGGGGSDAVDVQALLGFDHPWTLDALNNDRPQPRTVTLRQASYHHEGLELDVAGDVTADEEGRMSGELTVRAVNWQALLEQAREAGTLPDALADTLRDALSVAASLSGRRDTLDLPLTFRRGDMSFGMIPLGEAPRLRLP